MTTTLASSARARISHGTVDRGNAEPLSLVLSDWKTCGYVRRCVRAGLSDVALCVAGYKLAPPFA
jgi:hypothetical protein